MPLDAQPDMSFYASDAGLPGLYRGTNFLGRPTAVPIVGTTGLGLGSGASATPSGGGGSLGGGAGAFGTPVSPSTPSLSTPSPSTPSPSTPSGSEGPQSGAGTSVSQATGGGRSSAGTASASGVALGLSAASLAALLADKILGASGDESQTSETPSPDTSSAFPDYTGQSFESTFPEQIAAEQSMLNSETSSSGVLHVPPENVSVPIQATDPITGTPLTETNLDLVPNSVPGGRFGPQEENLPEQFFGPSQAEKFAAPATISETPSLEPPLATPPATEAEPAPPVDFSGAKIAIPGQVQSLPDISSTASAPATISETPSLKPSLATPPATEAEPAPPVDFSSIGEGLAAGTAGSYVLHQLPLEPRLAVESGLTLASLAAPPLAPFALGNLIPDLIGLFSGNAMQFPASTFDALGTSVRNVLPPTLPMPSGATPEQRAAIQAANDKIATLEPYAYGQTGMGDRPSTLSGEQSPETWQNSLNQVVSSTIQPAFNDLGKLYPAALQAFASTQQSNPEWQPLLSALQSGDMTTARNLLFTAQSPTAQMGIARLRMQDVGVPYFEQQTEQSLSPEGTWPQFAPTAGGGEETMPNPFETSAPGPVGSDLQGVAKDIWSGYLPNYGTADNANPLIPATANYASTFPYNQPLLNLTEDALKAGVAGGPQFYVS